MPTPLPLQIRKARLEDLDRLVDIHFGAFPDGRGAEQRKRQLQANPFGGIDELYVAARGAHLVAHAMLYPMRAWFGGRRVATGGIGSVGVAAEARGQGIARAMVEHLHEVSRVRGDAITLLDAFRHAFYAPFGYAQVSPMIRLEVVPAAVPKPWVAAARGDIRPVERDDREALFRIYERAAAQKTGWLARGDILWEKGLIDERRAWFITGDGRGYLSWAADKGESGVRLTVHELVAEDDATWRTLWGHLGAQKDQIHCIDVDVAQDDPALFALIDIDGHRSGMHRMEHPWGTTYAGPMVRVHGVAAALEARGYAVDGSITLGTLDRAYLLEIHHGVGSVREAGAADVDLVFSDLAALASVAYGGLRPSQASRAGLVTGRDASALARADQIFMLPAYHVLDRF